MRLEDVLAHVLEPASYAILNPHWEESVRSLGDHIPEFLTDQEVKDARAWSGLAAEHETALLAMAARIRSDRALTLLAWHCHQLLYRHVEYPDCRKWPDMQGMLGDQRGVFYLLIALAMIPPTRAVHREMGVPGEITRSTCSQVSCLARNFAGANDGLLGFPLRSIYWLRHYPAARLFRLGRFEYKLEPFHGRVVVFRHRANGRVLALAGNGMRYDAEGFVAATGLAQSWEARLQINGSSITGYPIAPLGFAVHHEVELPAAEWECVLAKGDFVLDLHIPAGGGMSPEKCRDSLRSAVPFFRRFFPQKPFRAIASNSWIFNPMLEHIQFSSDNLVRFQRELYLFPMPSSGTDGLWFVFNRDPFDLATAPLNTSLQRGVANWLASGGRWCSGGMFLLTEHLPLYGSCVYRSQWPCTAIAPETPTA